MKKLSCNEIRKMFLDFFESKGHLVMPSASLIPNNDPSLLWINAGVAPLKKYFDGREVPPKKRLTNAQKCIRTNDIENVGDTYHHTFFEMLGNFSIGDYFREEALGYAWELLTSDKWFGIPKDKLYVTVYSDDRESYNRWLELGLDKSHIIKCEGNFWDIGPGPCGPDSEIFYDKGEKYDKRGPELIENDIDNDRFIEIWNNVFSQFNHVEGLKRDEFPELPHKNIDTGMGLERLVCLLQGVDTDYETDLFTPIINKIEELTGVKYTNQRSIRSIADHIKTLTFALSDGAEFSNEGRGYVLRRILRRACRFGRTLGIYEPFMYKLTDSVIETMKDYYPYLKDNKKLIDKLIKREEEVFLKTLESGEKRLKELEESGKKITGEDVFKLYDTYGFPYELTEEILNEKGIKINKEEFDKCMQEQRDRARSALKNVSSMSSQSDLVDFKDESKFVYDTLKLESKVIYTGDLEGNKMDLVGDGIIILDKTPFYATMGGQKCDIGTVYNDNFKADVINVEKAPNGQHVLYVNNTFGSLQVNDKLTCKVNEENRYTTCQNHTATHLLQKALQDVLGNEVHQAGSYVDGERLRFDFKYTEKIKDEDLYKVESLVNDMIKASYEADINEMDIKEAKKLGAMALFDDKYKEKVRVVKFGPSIELCGGTHIDNTSNIKSFAIKSIESKGLNIYRIEAVCDTNLEVELYEEIKPYNNEMITLLEKAKDIVAKAKIEGIELEMNISISNERPKCYKDIIENRLEVTNLRKSLADLEKTYNDKKIEKASSSVDDYLKEKQKGLYGEVLLLELENQDMNVLKSIIGNLESKLDNGIVFIINKNEESVNFLARCNNSLKDKVNMGTLVKNAALIVDGNGGGSPFFAQGGGNYVERVEDVVSYVKDNILK